MLLEQRPTLRPPLNTFLTVLCTSLSLNYSTLLMEKLTVTVCWLQFSVCVCVDQTACVFQESRTNISSLHKSKCKFCFVFFICELEIERRMLLGDTEQGLGVWVAASVYMCTCLSSLLKRVCSHTFYLLLFQEESRVQSILFSLSILNDCRLVPHSICILSCIFFPCVRLFYFFCTFLSSVCLFPAHLHYVYARECVDSKCWGLILC